ncbi:uncharacterized protein LOC135150510 [Daucus carota subsp. sativus]|uniref:uncharacterized protein LOC135150510 n=1 Tax=Daucus carota subsp. sativus TaxID=79200 RepID=UPI003083A20E
MSLDDVFGRLKTHELEMEQRSKRHGGKSKSVALKVQEEAAKSKGKAHKRRRRLVAAYEFDDLEPAQDVNPEPIPTTTNEPAQPSPKPARFKRRAHKPKRAKIPESEITDFTIQEEQAPSSSIPDDSSQPLMVDPLQAVPLISPTTSPKATSTASAVDEEIACDAQATTEAGATMSQMSDPKSPISDHGHSTPIPHSPMKIPENAIVHDTAPENYRSDVVDETDKVAVEVLQTLAQTGEEPIKSQSEDKGKSAQDNVEQVADPVPADEKANSDPEDDASSDTDKDENAEVPLTQQKWESTSQFNARKKKDDDDDADDFTKHKRFQAGTGRRVSNSDSSKPKQSSKSVPVPTHNVTSGSKQRPLAGSDQPMTDEELANV